MAENDLPPLDSPTAPPLPEEMPAPLDTEKEAIENVQEPLQIGNKRKRPPRAMKSIGRRPPPKLAAPPKKKQRIMEETPSFLKQRENDEDEELEEGYLPDMNDLELNLPVAASESFAPNGVLQGGLGDPVALHAAGEAEDHYDECPFTAEEMSAPLVIPGEPQVDSTYKPYIYDQGYDTDRRQEDYEEEYDEGDFFEPSKRRKSRKRSKTIRNSATVSLSALLASTDGVDADYCKERKAFYDSLEAFLKRTPDVNLLCGAPVDLYALYTETFNRGGFDAVCQAKQWRQIFRQLPQYSSTHTSASYALKKMYKKNLYEYEQAQRNGFS